MKLLALTHATSVDDVLPGLSLLPQYSVTLVAPTLGAFLAAADGAEGVLVDGCRQPLNACELAHGVASARPDLPTIGVVAERSAPEVGADCAVVQLLMTDAGPAEIDARLRLAGRSRPAREARREQRPGGGSVLAVGDLVIDAGSYTARVGDRPLRLARREFELLAELAVHAGRPLSRRHLLARVWDGDYEGSARTVDVHVRQLRRSLGEGHRDMIRTVRGTGYVLVRGAAPAPPPEQYTLVHRLAAPARTVAAGLSASVAVRDDVRPPARADGRDTPADVVASKRAGLPLDLDALVRSGRISALERYSLKTLGACPQSGRDTYLVRGRTRGEMTVSSARALAALAREQARGRVHLTTRQQVELHHVHGAGIPAVLDRMRDAGIDTASTCGHTVRGITVCPDAGVSLDEPFDCGPDATLLARSLLALCPDLNTRMPQRFNIAVGGCPACRDQAKISDVGLVSTIAADGRAGYELWIGGSLGKSAPTLATRVIDFVPRGRLLPAVHAVLEVFLGHGSFERPGRGRLKFLVARIGIERFVELLTEAYTAARTREWPEPPHVETPAAPPLSGLLARAPDGGWSAGVRPQRRAGLATVTVTVPLGELEADTLDHLAGLAETFGDATLRPTREQNLVIRDVAVERITALRAELATVGLRVHSSAQARDVRACAAGTCPLALTPAQRLGGRLWELPSLVRNSGLRVSISGCPSSCAQHQVADLGFEGSWVAIDGERVLGYRVHLGGDLRRDRLGHVLGRIAESDVEAVTDRLVAAWERLRRPGETLADTVDRVGPGPFDAALTERPSLRWETGDASPALVGDV